MNDHVFPQPSSTIDASAASLCLPNTLRIRFSNKTNSIVMAALSRVCDHWTLVCGKPTGLRPVSIDDDVDLQIDITEASEAIPQFGVDESYELTVDEGGIRLSAPTVWGALAACQSLAQLPELTIDGQLEIEAQKLSDAPRYPWRGFMIDVARRFIPLSVLKRQIDAMSLVKLNVLHLHLTDNEGFRFECKSYPRLHELGSNGRYYTQDELRDLVSYAAARGVRIVPEFDVPGHALSWIVAYPELGSSNGAVYDFEDTVKQGYREALDPSKPVVYDIVDAVLREAAEIFPDDCMHVGGDEVWATAWSNAHLKTFSAEHGLKGNHGLQAHFNEKVFPMFAKHGKRLMGWEEIVGAGNTPDAIIQTWMTGLAKMKDASNLNVVVSQGYYLDHLLPAAAHHAPDPSATVAEQVDAATFETVNILGGEAAIWTPVTGPENFDIHNWPNLAAVADRLWSGEAANGDTLQKRLDALRPHLRAIGVDPERDRRQVMARNVPDCPDDKLVLLSEALSPLIFYQAIAEVASRPQDALLRFADGVSPNSDRLRALNAAVAQLTNGTASQDAAKQVRELAKEWTTNDADLQSILANASEGSEAATARDLSRLVGELSGLMTLCIDAMEDDKRLTNTEIEQAEGLLERTKPLETLEVMGGLIMEELQNSDIVDFEAFRPKMQAALPDFEVAGLRTVNIGIHSAARQLLDTVRSPAGTGVQGA